jgi:hypothetical protein
MRLQRRSEVWGLKDEGPRSRSLCKWSEQFTYHRFALHTAVTFGRPRSAPIHTHCHRHPTNSAFVSVSRMKNTVLRRGNVRTVRSPFVGPRGLGCPGSRRRAEPRLAEDLRGVDGNHPHSVSVQPGKGIGRGARAHLDQTGNPLVPLLIRRSKILDGAPVGEYEGGVELACPDIVVD